MSSKEQKQSQVKELTNIENDVIFKGTFDFTNQLIVKGSLYGEVKGKDGSIIIETTGLVNGSLEADFVENKGTLQGKAKINHYLVESSGVNECDVIIKEITVERGAKMSGLLTMISED